MSDFFCEICKKKFSRAYNLKRHLERKIPCKVVEEKKTYQNIPTAQKNIPKHTKTYQEVMKTKIWVRLLKKLSKTNFPVNTAKSHFPLRIVFIVI